MSDETEKDPGLTTRGLVTAAVKSGLKAVSGARVVWKSTGARKIRGSVKTVVGGLAGVSRFVRTNTLRGLLDGEIILKEGDLNRWLKRVDPPEQVSNLALRCCPSRLVLSLQFERKVLGVRIIKTSVDLPFEIESISLDAEGGSVVLRLDEESRTPARGFLRPIILRLLSRAAADLMDDDPLDELDDYSDLIDRDGDLFTVHIGDYPPFVELMNRQLRLPGGRSLVPFKALAIYDAQVEEGQLVIRVRYDTDRITEESHAELEFEDDDTVEVTILKLHSDDDLDSDD